MTIGITVNDEAEEILWELIDELRPGQEFSHGQLTSWGATRVEHGLGSGLRFARTKELAHARYVALWMGVLRGARPVIDTALANGWIEKGRGIHLYVRARSA